MALLTWCKDILGQEWDVLHTIVIDEDEFEIVNQFDCKENLGHILESFN